MLYPLLDSHEEMFGEGDQTSDSDNVSSEDIAMDTEGVSMDTEGTPSTNGGQGLVVEYNPLVVRRSNRAIKPTKDIDLYLLGAQYGVDLEGSELDSSDSEFSPDRKQKGS